MTQWRKLLKRSNPDRRDGNRFFNEMKSEAVMYMSGEIDTHVIATSFVITS
jgi:hypothetical protein